MIDPGPLSPASLARMHALFGDDYPSEVKTLARSMHNAGQTLDAIRAALLEVYGKAPDADALARLLEDWQVRPSTLSHASHCAVLSATHADIRPLVPDGVHVVVSGPEGRRVQLHADTGPALYRDAASARAALLAINPRIEVRS